MSPITPKYSVIVPVYNRPHEIDELLSSLCRQQYTHFEVIIVEDGSTIPCREIVDKYTHQLSITYFFKSNSGPGPSRNAGFEKARGDYFVVFDSDCVIPETYFQAVENFLSDHAIDGWGGPDQGHASFTPLQQAMAYTMSSFLTTGGIRGGKRKIGFYQARSFNMGLSRHAWQKTAGFQFDRLAEDIELSVRMRQLGLQVELIPDAFVYHKRRTSFRQFFFQVANFGRGRILVGAKHPGEVKWVHWFPAFFTIGFVVMLLSPLITPIGYYLYACAFAYLIVLFLDALRITQSFQVAWLSVPSAIIQLTGYGLGFLAQKLKTLHII
ncbi:MAG: glycosyltransferase [Cyclobacteriaceae bacterium]|jgi:glycosyltransferase involved in cell wall biosynthesis